MAKFGVVNDQGLWHVKSSQLNREFTMSFKKASLVAMLAASMTSAPVLAQTVTAASPVAASARVGADMSDESDLRGGFIIPLIAVVALILGVLAATGGGDDGPSSP